MDDVKNVYIESRQSNVVISRKLIKNVKITLGVQRYNIVTKWVFSYFV